MTAATSLRISGKREEERKLLFGAGKILPGEPIWHSEIADMYATDGKKTSALDQHNLAMHGRLASRAYLRATSFLREKKRYSDALKVCQHLARLKPRSTEPLQAIANVYLAEKNYEITEKYLFKAFAIDNQTDSIYLDLGRCYTLQGNDAKTRKIYEQGIAVCPQSVGLLKRLIQLDIKSGNEADARMYLDKMIAQTTNSLNDKNVLVQNDAAWAYAQKGALSYRDKKYGEALQEAKLFNKLKFIVPLPPILTLIHLRPGRVEPGSTKAEVEYADHIMLADMLREGGLLDDCISEFRKAEALNSDDIDLHSYLLNALDEKGDMIESAKEDLILSSKLVNKVPGELERFTHKKAAQAKPQSPRLESPPKTLN